MKKHEGSAASRYSGGLTAVSRLYIVLLICCFAACAAGSCLSYGHSCWGAHGKRSYNSPGISQHRQIDAREDRRPAAEAETDGNPATPNTQNRWFLSRLITGRLAVPAIASIAGKHPGNRWHERQSIVGLPENWDDYDTTRNEIFRNEKAEIEEAIGDSKNLIGRLDLTQKMTEPRDETTELLFVPSRNEYVNHHPSYTRKLRLYKIMTDSSDKMLQ